MANKIIVVSEDKKGQKERSFEKVFDEDLDAYLNRGVLTPPINLLELPKIGIWRIDEDSWDGFDYPPSECIPHGNIEKRTNGSDEILVFVDDNQFTAELRKINGEWQIDDDNNPGGWEYLPTLPVEQYNEEGEQLGITGFMKGGKFMGMAQFAIKPGEKFKGLLPRDTIISGVPVPDNGQPFASINGTYIFYVPDWDAISDGPQNLKGPGFLKVSYYDGIVHFQAFDFTDGETNFAYATIPGAGQAMTTWRIDTDIFCTIERLENTLLLYALKGHNHDDRHYVKSEIRTILLEYKLAEWFPEISEVKGLAVSLANKLDVGLFQSALPVDAIVLGAGGVPVAADLTDAYTTTVALVNAKEGVAYTTVIEDISLIYPRGAENKRIAAVASGRWMGFSGAIVGGSGANLTISGTPTSAGVVMISLDFIWTIAGMERREQRILFLTVEPAATTITAPNAPTGLTATAISTSQINLSWVDNATNEAVQELQRSIYADFTDAVKIATVNANVTDYQDKVGLLPGVNYHYRVRASNSTDNSAWANANATTLSEPVITSGLHANYYDTVNIRALGAAATARTDNTINFDVTNDAPAGAAVTTGAFIVRWSGKIKPPVSGSYQFSFGTNARTRIYFGGVLVVNSFESDALRTLVFTRTIAANEEVPILIEYLQNNDDTYARLGYQNGATDTVVPTTWLIAENIAPLAIPVLTVAALDADSIRLSWTLTADPDNYEVFGGLDSTSALPILDNITATGTARTVDVNGLTSGLTFFFEIRSKKNGIYSELSNRASASTPLASERPKNAAPVLISRSLVNPTQLTIGFQDNNSGSTETYGFRFQQVNTTAWKYLNSSSGLSDNAADMDFRSYPFEGTLRTLVLANDFFSNKLIRVEIIVEKDDVLSEWAGAQETAGPVQNQFPDVMYMEAFEVVKDPTTGLWYDAKAETDNASFHNFYLCEDRPELLLNDDGSPKAFRGVALPDYAYLMFRKLRLNKGVYPVYQKWMSSAWLSNITGGTPSYVQYCAQNVVRTFDESVIGGPDDDGPEDPQPNDRTGIQNTAYSFLINLYTMSYTNWRTTQIKQMADAHVAAGFKAIQLSFSPYKVWNNYVSAGAFNADSLTWDWSKISDIINYVCNTKGLKLIVRLFPDMSDYSLTTLAANADTPDLTAAWGSYFDKNSVGSIMGLKIDNYSTPPWLLFRRFCAAFRAQYNNYWNTGKILIWEFATNNNQEGQIFPDSTTISYPNYVEYVNRTEQMYEMGQVMLGEMAGWEDGQWNVGSWINDGYQLKGNTMGYNRYTAGFRGMRGNHDSNWSPELRDFHDIIMYTRKQKGTNRFYSVEYFVKDNLTEPAAMTAAIKRSMNNGAWLVGFVYADDDFSKVLNYIIDMGTRLGTDYRTRALATPTVNPTENVFSLKTAWTQSPVSGHNLMVAAFNNYRNANGNPQFIGVDYTIPNAPVIDVVRYNSNTIDVKVADTNTGKTDFFEINFREVGTSAWYTLNNTGTLTLSNSTPLLSQQANNNNTWNYTQVVTNSLFVGKTIEARARAWVNDIPSPWSTIVPE
ncbi:hypothetical protein GVN20_05715 [Runella sp. CRIBMP]|uniref:PA14 domain-containing protein n=1 Tax=Runella sp. CRIBMP TaxID=2683261 RepID=UPI0014122D69|nr:PA14 domain-containing protein [Runella sp. CRIBMP]NBB18847.1 hypothetical protein [Runella sp. CRIBMP]